MFLRSKLKINVALTRGHKIFFLQFVRIFNKCFQFLHLPTFSKAAWDTVWMHFFLKCLWKGEDINMNSHVKWMSCFLFKTFSFKAVSVTYFFLVFSGKEKKKQARWWLNNRLAKVLFDYGSAMWPKETNMFRFEHMVHIVVVTHWAGGSPPDLIRKSSSFQLVVWLLV